MSRAETYEPAKTRGYLRHPAIHGETVVFCCEDDLWSVPASGGTASRLTAATSECAYPRFSPDGRRVAFVASHDGPAEVYTMAADGGPARRLTYQAAVRPLVAGWHPDTGEILYASTAEQADGFGHRLYAVGPHGGPPRLFDPGPAFAVGFGPGGARVLARSIADPARRKRYRGGAAGELWVDRGDGRYRRLELPGNPANPCWVGGRVYFVDDHEGVGNVYSVLPDGSGLLRHTEHTDFYARGLSTDGRRLVYHAAARLHLIDPSDPEAEGGLGRRIDVTLAASASERERRYVTAAEYHDGVQVSPDGLSVAVTARGKSFTFAHWSGPVRRHGAQDGTRYRLLRWLAGGERLAAVAADEAADERIALLPAAGGPECARIPLPGIGCVTELTASPVDGHLAFATNRQQLWVLDTDAARPVPRLLDASAYERIEDLCWSPDGRWLAYSCPASRQTTAIKIANLAEGRTVRVTEPVLRDVMPVFDPGGRYLYFLGQRDLTPEIDQIQFEIGFPFGTRPFLITLRAGDPVPFTGIPLPLEESATEPGTPAVRPEVEIDFEGIASRVVPLPVSEGRYASLVPLYDSVLLLTVPVAAPEPGRAGGASPDGVVVSVDLECGDVTGRYIAPADEIQAAAAAGVLLYRHDDRLRVVPTGLSREQLEQNSPPDTTPGRRTGWLDLDRVKVPFVPAAEWRQMFREAWRLQRESFWNAAMSGVDWDAVYARYLPVVDLVGSRAELSDLLWELQGELGTSHAYERGGDYSRAEGQAQGFLGVDWEPWDSEAAAGHWRIARVLCGDPWNPEAASPCGRPGAGIRAGDEITAVDGRAVGAAGPGELLVGLAGHEVELTVLRPGAAERRVVVCTARGETRPRYLDWVAGNRGFVHEHSGGRLGYLHVPDMHSTGYVDFIRGFLAELDRDGLIVDVRNNTGGFVSPLLLDRLARKRTGAETGRWTGVNPYPTEAPRGPMAVLVNEQTGSDGEIFSHNFRLLGLGRLIGTRSWGGTIATWPRHALADGTVTTQPEYRLSFRGVGGGLENHGVEPDIEVVVPPGRGMQAADPQLEGAVRHLLGVLEASAAREPAGHEPDPQAARAEAGRSLVGVRSETWTR
jgi:tricorn protease